MSGNDIGHRQSNRSRHGRRVLPCLIALLFAQWAAAQPGDHDAAVGLARDGQLEQSIVMLSDLLERAEPGTPEATDLRHDLGVVRSWHGDHRQAVDLLSVTPLDQQPLYVLAAYAESLDQLGRRDEASAAFRAWSSRDSSAIRPATMVFHALIDAGDLAGAEAQLELMSQHFDDPALRFSAAHLARAKGNHLEALREYDAVLKDDPGNVEALRGKALIALNLGAPWQALAVAEQHPGILTEEETRRIVLDTAANKLRWSTQTSDTQLERIDQSTAAFELQEQLLGATGLEGLDLSEPLDRALFFDRIVAHTSRFEMAEAVAAFELARETAPAGLEFPPYVLKSAADGYLYLRRPEPAEALYRLALAADPDYFDAATGLFYALSDQGDYEQAGEVLDQQLSEQPAWIRPASTIWLENPRFASATHLHALSPAYSGDYDKALERLDALLEIAPANRSARTARAQVMRWRGWPRAAQRETVRTLGEAPDDVEARTTRAHAMMDIYRFEEAESLVGRLDRLAPFDAGVRNVSRRWKLHNRPELSSEASYRHSDGSAIASEEWQIDTLLMSGPLRKRFRLFAHDLVRRAEFVEGVGRDHRLGFGVEYRHAGVRLSSELSGGFEDNRDAGLNLDSEWHLDDHWSVNAGAAVNSPNVPLRATRVGIRGNEISLGGAYRWHEARRLSAAATFIDMDDGNQRSAVQASYAQRLQRWRRQSLRGRVDVHASHNSGGERIYFNPDSDLNVAAGLEHEWLIFRRYDRSLVQRIGGDLGNYWQESYGSSLIWTVHLEHDWQLSDRVSLSYGAHAGTRVYDGDDESVAALYLSVRTRL